MYTLSLKNKINLFIICFLVVFSLNFIPTKVNYNVQRASTFSKITYYTFDSAKNPFILRTEKVSAILPILLGVLAPEIVAGVGTLLVTAAGYYAVSTGMLDPVIDKCVDTIMQMGDGLVKIYDDGKVWIANKAITTVFDVIKNTSTTVTDNTTNVLYDRVHIKDSSTCYIDMSGVNAGDVINLPKLVNKFLAPVSFDVSSTTVGIGSIKVDAVTSTYVTVSFGYTHVQNGLSGYYMPKNIPIGSNIEFPNTNLSIPSQTFNPETPKGWVDSTPKTGTQAYPSVSANPTSETEGVVVRPGVANPTVDSWGTYLPQDSVQTGTGTVAEDGTLTDTLEDVIEVPDTQTGFWSGLWNWLKKILDAILSIPGLIVTGIGNLLSALWEFLQSIVDGIGSIIANLTDSALAIDVEAVREGIMEPFKLPRFQQTWNIIQNFDTSSVEPPKLSINLGQLFSAGTSRFTNHNPFSNSETTFIDFSLLNQYSFGGMALIAYFRFLTGVGFIWTTFNYCWRKLTPDTVI
jgi:hypothetical protein